MVHKSTMKTEKELSEYILNAIENNYLLTILITSHTQGKKKESANLPFGMGKTTLEFWLNYYQNGESWDQTFDTTAYNPYDFICFMDPLKRLKEGRLNCASFDDMQASCPAEAGVPKAVRRLASYLTTNRPEVATIVGTSDNMNGIAAPLRKLIMFEIIVCQRGEYEVQKISYHKNFKKPLQDLGKLDYLEEGTFPPLPQPQQERYDKWRAVQKSKIYPQLKAELLAYAKLKDWDVSDIEKGVATSLTIPVSKNGRDYVLRLPPELGEKLYRETLTVALAKEQ